MSVDVVSVHTYPSQVAEFSRIIVGSKVVEAEVWIFFFSFVGKLRSLCPWPRSVAAYSRN